MKREKYNKQILDKCLELLESTDLNEVCEGASLFAYLIEQSFKSELRKINSLLYFDRKNISDEMEICMATGKLSIEEIKYLKTSTAVQCINQICKLKNDVKICRANIEELFKIRNFVLHSTDDIPFSINYVAETAVSALRNCKKYIIRYSDMASRDFTPLTSEEFNKFQKKQHDKRVNDLKKVLEKHKKIFKKFNKKEAFQKIINNIPKIDSYTWIEETTECPACEQSSLDKIGQVDFDWNPDGIIESGGYYYLCRVCELTLSEYELEMIDLEINKKLG